MDAPAQPVVSVPLIQLMQIIDQKLDEKLGDLRSTLSRLAEDRPTRTEMQVKIAESVKPIEALINKQSGELTQLRIEVATLSGQVSTLTTLRGEKMESMAEKIEDIKRETDLTQSSLAGLIGDVRTVREDIYGNPNVPNSAPSIFGLLKESNESSRALADSINKLSVSIREEVQALESRVAANERYIASRRAWETRVINALKSAWDFGWKTWRGRAVAALVAAGTGLALYEQAHPGTVEQMLRQLLP